LAGHITKRKRGDTTKWRARYPDPTRGGTAQIERTFDRRKEAERWLTEQKSSVHRGLHIDPRDTERRFIHVADAWRATWLELEPKTKAGYDSILNKHILPRWQDARIGAVDAGSVQAWINELAASGRSPKTVRNIYGALRSALNVAVEHRYITANPCDAVRLPRRSAYGDNGTNRPNVVLEAAEVAMVAEAITPHYRVLIYTAAYSGLRAGELGALRRRHIDLLHGKLHVHGALKEINSTSPSLHDDERGLVFGTTKTDKDRTVGIPRFLVAMLTEHLETISADPDALVFTSSQGGPHRHDNFRKRHFYPAVRRRYCTDCDTTVKPKTERCPECDSDNLVYLLPEVKHGLRFHDLRHTCATMLIAGGAPALAIRDHLGHQDIQTTMNVYGHLYPSMQDAMASTLDAAYAGSTDSANVRALREDAGR
jgi:integrase